VQGPFKRLPEFAPGVYPGLLGSAGVCRLGNGGHMAAYRRRVFALGLQGWRAERRLRLLGFAGGAGGAGGQKKGSGGGSGGAVEALCSTQKPTGRTSARGGPGGASRPSASIVLGLTASGGIEIRGPNRNFGWGIAVGTGLSPVPPS